MHNLGSSISNTMVGIQTIFYNIFHLRRDLRHQFFYFLFEIWVYFTSELFHGLYVEALVIDALPLEDREEDHS